MSDNSNNSRSAQDLVRFLRGRGISTAEIAAELHRSPRMVRKILNGETSGALYRSTLEELATTGRVSSVPPRRRLKTGGLVPVRAKSGGKQKTVVPEDPGGTYTSARQGGAMQASTTYMAEGGRQVELRLPKGKAAKGRTTADAELVRQIRNAAKGQARDNQKKIRATLTFANGRVMEVNTYNASTMLQRVNESGGSALEWMRGESKNRYVNLDVSRETITGVTLTVFAEAKTPEYEDFKAQGRPRRSRALNPAETRRQEEKARLEQGRRRGGRRS